MGRLGLGSARGARRSRGASGSPGPAPSAGTAASNFAAAPTVHYHFHSQSVAIDGNSRLTACPDRQGLAGLAAVSGTTAPRLMTDALGRRFLRFNGSEAAVIENALAGLANRGFTALAVARVHHARATCHILNPRFAAYTSPTVNTAANASIGLMRATVTSASANFLQAGPPAASTNATDCYKVIPGTQLQVLAVASRTTANGGTRLYCNSDFCDVAQQTTSVTGYIGAVVGASAGANNSEAPTLSVNNVLDIYELAIWTGELSNTVANAAVAAAVANFAIAPLDTNLVLDGDSIIDGVATTQPESPAYARGIGSRLTEPGSSWIAANVRVLNLATSGNSVSHLVTKRDAANSVFAAGRYPGGAAKNLIAVQIGRNDLVATATTAATHYANVTALLNTASTGYLQRGWRVAQVANIAGANSSIPGSPSDGPTTLQQRVESFRGMIMTGTAINLTFAGDTLSGVGQTYDGLVSVLPVSEITVSTATKFKTAANAADAAGGLYDNDSTHLTVGGCDLAISGGDQPAYGFGALA